MATDTPLRLRSSASHSTPMVHVGTVCAAHGSAVTSCWPARSRTCRLSAPNGPEPTLYRSVSAWVWIVSQPSVVCLVKLVGAKPSRPIALNVGASMKCASPAYSVRMSVGESTSKRASPEVTADA